MSTWSPQGLGEFRVHYRWAVVALTAMFVVLFYRFFLLQIMRGVSYRQDQVAAQRRSERIPARRGLIVDRNGEVLAFDVETHDLVMNPRRAKASEQSIELLRRVLRLSDEEYAQLREIVAVGIENRDRYDRIVVRRDLISDHSPENNAALVPLDHPRTALWCNHCGRVMQAIDPSATRCPLNPRHRLDWNEHHTGAVCHKDHHEYAAGTACPYDGAVLRKRTYTLQDPDTGTLYNNERAVLESHLYEMPGFEIRSSTRRMYPYGNLMAHITGYMNKVNAKDLKKHPGQYQPTDRIGRAGVERAMEAELRGTWGENHYLLDRPTSHGPLVRHADPEHPDIAVRDGRTVVVTIDVELQKVVRDALRYHRSGAAVLLDARTGEVLAMYSKPSFDPNLWSGRLPPEVYRATIRSPYSPMLNKALTAYAPGSVYKIVTAVAALHAGLTDFKEKIVCHGYKEFHKRRFHCHNRFGHGPLDLNHAMVRSCDIFFYELGERLSMDRLAEYATNYFGFGGATGIEISESKGLVPNRAWHEKRDGRWMPGFTLSTAVGQKDVRTTPLQIARAYAAFATDLSLKTVSVIRQLEDRKGNVVWVTPPARVTAHIPITEDDSSRLRESFWRVVNDEHGTAFKARMDGIEVSGKTGTAEAPERKVGVSDEIAKWLQQDHAWFAAYAPSRKPEVSVAVFLDHGGPGGKMAAPVAMKIFKGYFRKRERDFAAGQLPAERLPNPVNPEPEAGDRRPQGAPHGHNP